MEQTDLAPQLEKARNMVFTAAEQSDFLAVLVIALTNIHQVAEDLLALQDKDERSLIACHAGCDHCCVVNVSISLVEGVAIINFLKQINDTDRLKIIERLDHLWSRIRGLDDEERLALRTHCAFLGDNGLCQIYPVRPLFCCRATSTDPEACKNAVCCKLQGETELILMNQYQQQLYEILYLAISEGLEHAGLDGRSFQMTGLIRYLLKNPEGASALLRDGGLSWYDLYA